MFRGSAPLASMTRGDSGFRRAFALSSRASTAASCSDQLVCEYVRIYPMPVWLEIEQKLGEMPSTHPSRVRFLDRINYFGQVGELDAQGRVLIPARLREAATMAGVVDVLGQFNCLDVWNHDRFMTKLQRELYTDEDARALSEFGI